LQSYVCRRILAEHADVANPAQAAVSEQAAFQRLLRDLKADDRQADPARA
jgi:hypothetical protein